MVQNSKSNVSLEAISYGKGDFEKDMSDVIELCSTWWGDSLFHKLYGIEYDVDSSLFRQLKAVKMLIYTCGRNTEGKLVSCYVGVKSPYMFNPKLISATEIVWCVRKEHRSFRVLIGLTRAIKNLMEEENIPMWNLNVSNEEKYNSTCAFLEKNNYKLMDRVYSIYNKGDSDG